VKEEGMAKKGTTSSKDRSAVSVRYVSKNYGKSPKTTAKETK